jgi:hypothetical protein
MPDLTITTKRNNRDEMSCRAPRIQWRSHDMSIRHGTKRNHRKKRWQRGFTKRLVKPLNNWQQCGGPLGHLRIIPLWTDNSMFSARCQFNNICIHTPLDKHVMKCKLRSTIPKLCLKASKDPLCNTRNVSKFFRFLLHLTTISQTHTLYSVDSEGDC